MTERNISGILEADKGLQLWEDSYKLVSHSSLKGRHLGAPRSTTFELRQGMTWGKILIVDDEEAVRRLPGNILRELQVETIVADDGLEALELVHMESPQLILSDRAATRPIGTFRIRCRRSSMQV